MRKKKKMGRPRKHKKAMGHRVTVRLTAGQARKFGQAADRQEMAISEWLRWLGDRAIDSDAGNVVDS